MEQAIPSTTLTSAAAPTTPQDMDNGTTHKVFTFDAADVVSLTKMDPTAFNANTDPCQAFPEDGQAGVVPKIYVAEESDELDLKYPVDVQQWRDTGFGAYRYGVADTLYPGFWRPAYGGYPVSGPSSGLSRESSRDDLTSMEGQIFEFEERFRVDRRKLELMMIGRYEPIKETAIDFFQRIGEETSTTIIWPSRLKIGAKSKKDPHIRIGGTEECVKRAKSLIMEYLDTKTTRVTMKMDVSYTDHSHVIGKGGNTIRRVMAETGCHIHFPDSNRSNPNEKSNQVSIAGEMEGVERARARVRELAPLVFTFDLPIVPSIESMPHDMNDPYLKAVQDQYNIQVMFKQKQKNFPTTVVVIKGCEWESSRVKEATLMLVDHLCGRYTSPPSSAGLTPGDGRIGSFAHTVPISMNMEISPIHHGVVLGKGNMTLRTIMQRTKTTILFPDAGDPNIPPIRKGSVTITGSIHNVYFARQQLLGSLPIVMMFEMPDSLNVLDEAGIQKLQEDLDVCISIKPKQRQANKSVLIKAQERNASSMYRARHILLGLDGQAIEATVPETYKMQQSGPGDTFYSLNNNDTPYRLPTPKPFPVGGGFNPMIFHGLPNNRLQFYHPVEAAAAAAAAANQDHMMALLHQKHTYPPPPDLVAAKPATPGFGSPRPEAPRKCNFTQPPPHLGNGLPPNHPYLQDYARLVLKNITRLQQQEQKDDLNNNYVQDKDEVKVSPRNSSPVHELGNMSTQLEGMSLDDSRENRRSVSSSDQNRSDYGARMSGEPRGSASSENSNESTDWRAPGWEKKAMEMAAKSQIGDYEAKRLLAAKALQSKPNAKEPRTPTTTWSGLGFSSSMPEKMIREQLGSESSLEHEPHGAAGVAMPPPVAPKSGGPPATPSATTAAPQGNWFGNSSALDSFLNSKTLVNEPGHFEDDLPSLFAKQGLAKYTDIFLRHEVDIQTFASLTEHDMKEIGIQTFGARKKLLLLANKLKQILSVDDSLRAHHW